MINIIITAITYALNVLRNISERTAGHNKKA